MRLLCIAHNFLVGGAQRVSCTLLRYFVQRGIEVELCSIAGGPLTSELPEGLRGTWIGGSRSGPTIQKAFSRARHADVVFALAEGSPAYLAAAAGTFHRRPTASWFHGMWGRAIADLRPWHRPCSAILYPGLHKAICVSSGCRDELIRYFPDIAPRAVVIPNFIDVAAIRTGARGMGGTPEGEYVVAAARLVGCKRIDLLIKAFAIASGRLGDVDLVIAGDGPERADLERLTATLDISHRVRFVGEVENAGSLIAGARMTVLPSIGETFGMVVVESMALGTPVIAFDHLGPRSILGEGLSDLLVAPGDIEALAERIVRLSNDERWREDVKARMAQRIWDFDVSRVGPSFEQIFSDMGERRN